jgi:arsenic resistance protein ArsH
VLYGSLRSTSYSRLLAFEFARVLESLGGDVRVFDPRGLPPHDTERSESHPKVVELRALSAWSEGHVWVSPEQHGAITGLFKTQLDWIPLSLGSVRPTQGRTLAVAQVSGGSQSFNAVNTLRLLGRWMRMICIPNQSSVPMAWTQFEKETGRMKAGDLRARVVDVAEELFRFTLLTRPHAAALVDRFSEREEVRAKGRLQSQAEKVAAEKAAAEKAAAEKAAAVGGAAAGGAAAGGAAVGGAAAGGAAAEAT